MTPIRVLLADPGWQPRDKLPGKSRGAEKNYHVMPTHKIMRFPIPEMERNGILFLWRMASMPQDALDVVKAWGFTPMSEIVWEKLTKTGKPWFGMGRYVRGSHETCLIATCGRFRPATKSIRSRFSAKAPIYRPGDIIPADKKIGDYIHSAKPEEFYSIVEQLTGGGPYCELFARKRRPGWLSVGDQLPEETT